MNREDIQNFLNTYLPGESVSTVASWIVQHEIKFTIAGNRRHVVGDFIPKRNGYHISVNGNLNPFAFLITTVHEVAHLATYEKYHRTVSAHGNEWKNSFNGLMNEFRGKKLFPSDVTTALKRYLENPSATHCNDPLLMKTLNKYNREPVLHLEDLKAGEFFLWDQNEIFRKGKKLRKRYICFHVSTNRKYFFSPVAEVKRIPSVGNHPSAHTLPQHVQRVGGKLYS